MLSGITWYMMHINWQPYNHTQSIITLYSSQKDNFSFEFFIQRAVVRRSLFSQRAGIRFYVFYQLLSFRQHLWQAQRYQADYCHQFSINNHSTIIPSLQGIPHRRTRENILENAYHLVQNASILDFDFKFLLNFFPFFLKMNFEFV